MYFMYVCVIYIRYITCLHMLYTMPVWTKILIALPVINKVSMYCIVLYCIVLYCIVLYCIVLYCIVLYCIVLYCIVLYCIQTKTTAATLQTGNVLYCIVLYCIVLYCIVLYCIVLYCIVLYCIVLYTDENNGGNAADRKCLQTGNVLFACIIAHVWLWQRFSLKFPSTRSKPVSHFLNASSPLHFSSFAPFHLKMAYYVEINW